MIDLEVLERLVRERSEAWGAAGIEWTVHRGPSTPKPAAWVVCETAGASGQLTVWVSGEAELEVGRLDRDDFDAVHFDLKDGDGLGKCLDELCRRLLNEPPTPP